MPTTTKGTGADLLVYLDGDDEVPVAKKFMSKKWTIGDLKRESQESTVVYLWNKICRIYHSQECKRWNSRNYQVHHFPATRR